MQKRCPFSKKVGVPLCLKRKFATSQILDVLAARLDATWQTATQAEYELATHLGYNGGKNLPNGVFQFTGIVIRFHEHFLSRAFTLNSRRYRYTVPFSRRNCMSVL